MGNPTYLARSSERTHRKLFYKPGSVLQILLLIIWAGLLPSAPAYPTLGFLSPPQMSHQHGLLWGLGRPSTLMHFPLGVRNSRTAGLPIPSRSSFLLALEREGREAEFENHSSSSLSATWGQSTEATSSYLLPQFITSPGKTSLYLVRKYQ